MNTVHSTSQKPVSGCLKEEPEIAKSIKLFMCVETQCYVRDATFFEDKGANLVQIAAVFGDRHSGQHNSSSYHVAFIPRKQVIKKPKSTYKRKWKIRENLDKCRLRNRGPGPHGSYVVWCPNFPQHKNEQEALFVPIGIEKLKKFIKYHVEPDEKITLVFYSLLEAVMFNAALERGEAQSSLKSVIGDNIGHIGYVRNRIEDEVTLNQTLGCEKSDFSMLTAVTKLKHNINSLPVYYETLDNFLENDHQESLKNRLKVVGEVSGFALFSCNEIPEFSKTDKKEEVNNTLNQRSANLRLLQRWPDSQFLTDQIEKATNILRDHDPDCWFYKEEQLETLADLPALPGDQPAQVDPEFEQRIENYRYGKLRHLNSTIFNNLRQVYFNDSYLIWKLKITWNLLKQRTSHFLALDAANSSNQVEESDPDYFQYLWRESAAEPPRKKMKLDKDEEDDSTSSNSTSQIPDASRIEIAIKKAKELSTVHCVSELVARHVMNPLPEGEQGYILKQEFDQCKITDQPLQQTIKVFVCLEMYEQKKLAVGPVQLAAAVGLHGPRLHVALQPWPSTKKTIEQPVLDLIGVEVEESPPKPDKKKEFKYFKDGIEAVELKEGLKQFSYLLRKSIRQEDNISLVFYSVLELVIFLRILKQNSLSFRKEVGTNIAYFCFVRGCIYESTTLNEAIFGEGAVSSRSCIRDSVVTLRDNISKFDVFYESADKFLERDLQSDWAFKDRDGVSNYQVISCNSLPPGTTVKWKVMMWNSLLKRLEFMLRSTQWPNSECLKARLETVMEFIRLHEPKCVLHYVPEKDWLGAKDVKFPSFMSNSLPATDTKDIWYEGRKMCEHRYHNLANHLDYACKQAKNYPEDRFVWWKKQVLQMEIARRALQEQETDGNQEGEEAIGSQGQEANGKQE